MYKISSRESKNNKDTCNRFTFEKYLRLVHISNAVITHPHELLFYTLLSDTKSAVRGRQSPLKYCEIIMD